MVDPSGKPGKVLVIGSGPIVIGQAAEFDYAGTQACKALREEGVTTVLVNSNPATIMTDGDIADRVYIEPLTVEVLERIIQRERLNIDPDSLPSGLEVSHVNLNDGTVEGLRHQDLPLFTIQYHSEASPGPQDNEYLFDHFLSLVAQFSS